MFDAKFFADLITVVRGSLGLVMVWLGVTQHEKALPIVIPMMILCWSGDFVDGMLARHSRHPRVTFIGSHDVQIDVFVSICLGLFMLFAGYVNTMLAGGYLIFWALIFWRFGLERNLLMLAQSPIYLYFILLSLREDTARAYLMVAWVALATALLWRRFSQEVVPDFIKAMISHWNNRSNKM